LGGGTRICALCRFLGWDFAVDVAVSCSARCESSPLFRSPSVPAFPYWRYCNLLFFLYKVVVLLQIEEDLRNSRWV
jgi:hypothetical protein